MSNICFSIVLLKWRKNNLKKGLKIVFWGMVYTMKTNILVWCFVFWVYTTSGISKVGYVLLKIKTISWLQIMITIILLV